MCLDSVTKITTLKHDRVAYKVIIKMMGAECGAYFHTPYNKRVNIVRASPVSFAKNNSYKIGFHCYLNRNDAKIDMKLWVKANHPSSKFYIKRYIIPKGSEVTIGKQNIRDEMLKSYGTANVIVSQVLINPRIKE